MRLKAGLIFVAATCGIFSLGALVAPPWASAHTLTGGSAQATCDAGTVAVTWTFTSSNASGHHIVGVQFDRRIDESDVAVDDTTVTAHTVEKPGATVHLTATVTWEDGVTSGHTVTTTIPDTVCPPATTTSTTEVTTSVPSSVPSSTAPVTTGSPTTTTPTSIPAGDLPVATTAASTQSSVVRGAIASTPSSTTRGSINLPATGTGSTIVWLAVVLVAAGTVAILITVRSGRP